MIVGFTGTRKGMNERQLNQLALMLICLHTGRPGARNEFHFGGARGADLEARAAAVEHAFEIVWHPCPGVVADEQTAGEHWRKVLPPLVRNQRIVDAVSVLLAAPHTDKEALRSGTWATIRYARAKGIPVVMLTRGWR
jgi:hypothetical protein